MWAMAHLPVNHPLRSVYRVLVFFIGVYLIVFGIVGISQSTGHPFFARQADITALGLHTNMAFSVLNIVAGAVLAAGAVYGRNVDHFINLIGGIVFLVAGVTMLGIERTSANFLNSTVRTCIVSFVIGMLLFAAGLYGKTSTGEAAEAEEAYRHGVTVTR
jgi:hypothetical protein